MDAIRYAVSFALLAVAIVVIPVGFYQEFVTHKKHRKRKK